MLLSPDIETNSPIRSRPAPFAHTMSDLSPNTHRWRWATWFILITILLAVGLNDLICHQILKPLFARARPCQVLELPHVIYNCSGSFSLPSNHASNSFTIAMLIALMVS